MPTQVESDPKLEQQFRRFQAARRGADEKLLALPHVVGTCFGMKYTAGTRTTSPCFTVLVSDKLPEKRLKPKSVIPGSVRRNGVEMETDVIRVGRLRQEGGFGIDDHVERGTVGAFATRGNVTYALSCAHCLRGPDSNPATPHPIRIEYPMPGTTILPLGTSSDYELSPGRGLFPDFGEMDAGLVRITSSTVADYVATRRNLDVYRPNGPLTPASATQMLRYTPLQGWGARTNQVVRAQIDGVLVSIRGRHFDLMISDPTGRGITQPGDSGLMWIGPRGEAYGLHMVGDGAAGGMSVNTFACFAFRPVDHFGVQLLDP